MALVKSLGLSAPGFRTEALSEVELCDLLADEVRAAPAAGAPVLAALRQGLKEPAFAQQPARRPVAADELLEVAGSDHGLAIALWRLVADPQPEVRARGAAALEQLAADWFGPAPEEAGAAGRGVPRRGPPEAEAELRPQADGRPRRSWPAPRAARPRRDAARATRPATSCRPS